MTCSTRYLLGTLVVALALLAAGCASTASREAARAEAEALASTAEAKAREGDYAEAARLYREAARIADEREARLYRLEAVGMLLDSGATAAAQELLASVPEQPRDEQARRHREVAWAAIALAEGRTRDAANLLAGMEITGGGALERRWLRTSAAVAAAQGDLIAAARARSRLARQLRGEPATANREALWALLQQVDPALLEAPPEPPDARLEGWMRLAAIARRYETNGGALMAALTTWAERFPDHPAMADRYPRLKETTLILGTRPGHVAVLLPSAGTFANAGNAVRDGIIAAWLQEPPTDRPRLSFYAADAETVWDTYAAAMDAGAEFVIGPLSKEAVTVLGGTERMPLPTLALNYLEPAAEISPLPPPAQLFQFGLSPEAEAREVALRAWFDGHQRALVLSPETAWGQRVGEAFTREWQALGGAVGERGAYGASPNEMSAAVAGLVNVDASAERGRTLRGILARDLKTEPRPRRDAQFVFLAAPARDARQLRPQLRFHRAGHLPVYSTSHVNAGGSDATAARDLEDIRFADMPWMVGGDHAGSTIKAGLARYWPNRMDNYARLFALGVDAYRLASELPRMHARPATRVEGVTGRIGLDPRRRVHRELTWAVFRDGAVELLDTPYDTVQP